MRHMIPCHFRFRKREIDRRNTLHQKKKRTRLKHDNVINIFTINKACENKLFTSSNGTPLNDMVVNHFSRVVATLLKAFIKVGIVEDPSSLKDVDALKKKGEASDARTVDETFIIELTHDNKSKEVMLQKP